MEEKTTYKIEDGGVTLPRGFSASHTGAGIRYRDRDDMAMIVSDCPCRAAGTFTRNLVKAAPVVYDRKRIDESPYIQAVVINAGIANACTGKAGEKACLATAEAAGTCLDIPPESVLTASTGVIGMPLPMDKVTAGVKAMTPHLDSTREAGRLAAKAIMTTDTHPKETAVSFRAGGKTVHIGGMTKGSGMIHPNMGTMLCFVTTDLAIIKPLMDKALHEAVRDSFNMISVDGDTSTNDTCILLANGEAGNMEITDEGEDYLAFKEALSYVLLDLARQIAGDGEGATRLFTCKVLHAASDADARTLAKSVISSNLTKAAIFGRDCNWGRILCALGYSGASFDPDRIDLSMESKKGHIDLLENGAVLNYREDEAKEIMGEEEVTAICDMKEGDYNATAFGCDLTYQYVKINADYRS